MGIPAKQRMRKVDLEAWEDAMRSRLGPGHYASPRHKVVPLRREGAAAARTKPAQPRWDAQTHRAELDASRRSRLARILGPAALCGTMARLALRHRMESSDRFKRVRESVRQRYQASPRIRGAEDRARALLRRINSRF